MLYAYLRLNIEDYIRNGDFKMLSIYLFLVCLFVAIQDVAIDGIVCDVLVDDDLDFGSSMQTLGQISGGFIGCQLYLLLSNQEWCQSAFGTQEAVLE